MHARPLSVWELTDHAAARRWLDEHPDNSTQSANMKKPNGHRQLPLGDGPKPGECRPMTRQPNGPAPDRQPMLVAALEYQRCGWSIIPMDLSGDKKKPARKWKPFQTRQPTDAELQTWFCNGSDFGMGVIFGAASGDLGSRDFDNMDEINDGQRFPALAATLPTVETQRGRHVYFQTLPEAIARLRHTLGKPDGIGAIGGPNEKN